MHTRYNGTTATVMNKFFLILLFLLVFLAKRVVGFSLLLGSGSTRTRTSLPMRVSNCKTRNTFHHGPQQEENGSTAAVKILQSLWLHSKLDFSDHDDDNDDISAAANTTTTTTTTTASSSSLSHLVSSPLQYATAMQMTIEQVASYQQQRAAASQALHEQLMLLKNATTRATTNRNGEQRQALVSQHVYQQHGKSAFVCRSCWTYQPICICQRAQRTRAQLQQQQQQQQQQHQKYDATTRNTMMDVQVLVWTHHDEWGSTSNTGSLLALLFPDNNNNTVQDVSSSCRHDGSVDPTRSTTIRATMLLKGLPAHDAILQSFLQEENASFLPIILWKGKGNAEPVKSAAAAAVTRLREDTAAASSQQVSSSGSNASLSSYAAAWCLTDVLARLDEERNQPTQEQQQHPQYEQSPAAPKKLILIVVEGTWRHARRMVRKLPAHIPRLSLSQSDVFSWRQQQEQDGKEQTFKYKQHLSLLEPLRKSKISSSSSDGEGDDIGGGKVCTAEAIVSALVGVKCLSTLDAHTILNLVANKVNLTARYQGKTLNAKTKRKTNL